jgi:hypothetical protein
MSNVESDPKESSNNNDYAAVEENNVPSFDDGWRREIFLRSERSAAVHESTVLRQLAELRKKNVKGELDRFLLGQDNSTPTKAKAVIDTF